MADNVLRTQGSGSTDTVATDQIPGTLEHYQKIKLYSSTADSTTAVADNHGVFVEGDVAADAALDANPLPGGGRASKAVPSAMSADGDAVTSWQSLQGATVSYPWANRQRLTATPTVTAATTNYTVATATASGDAVGGVLTFTIGATLRDNGPFRIVSANLTDRGAKAYWLRLHIFQVNPTSPAADNAAMDLTDANSETAQWAGYIDFRPGDASVHTSNAWCMGTYGGMPLTQSNALEGLCGDGTNKTTFYGQLEIIAAGAVAVTFYAGTTDVIVSLLVDTYA